MSQILRKKAREYLSAAIFAALLLASPGCSDEKDFSRSANLVAFFDPADPQPKNAVVSVFGGDTILYIRSDAEYSLTFRSSDKETNWVQVEKIGYDPAADAMKYRVKCNPMNGETFVKRTGTLSIVCPREYLGQFILFTQGFNTHLKEDFAWLNTGSDIPFNTTGEKLYETWTEVQKEIGWKAPLIGDQTQSYLYNKKGYIKLSDGTHAAQIVTPDLAKMVADSVVMLAFKGVAYVDEQGMQDGNKLTVSIENGGMFSDGTKQIELELPYYDPSAPDLAKTMWNGATRTLLLTTDKTEKFTDKTAIRFSVPEGANRAFLDDITLYIIDKESLYILDEDSMKANR